MAPGSKKKRTSESESGSQSKHISSNSKKSKNVSSTSSTPNALDHSPPSIKLPPKFPVQYPSTSQASLPPPNGKQISGGSHASSQTVRRSVVQTLQPPQPLHVTNRDPPSESESSSDSSDGEDDNDEIGVNAALDEGEDPAEGVDGLDGGDLGAYQPQNHHEAGHMSLEDLLAMPGRTTYLKRLSPVEGEGVWFDGEEETELVNKISKIIQDHFDGHWYSWNKVPTDIRDFLFCQLAHRYNWDPVITHLVREEFDEIAKRRLKGMIHYVRKYRNRPSWIKKTLWAEMVAYWKTKAARKRSKTASDARLSNRDGLGVYKRTGGSKSNARIKRELVKEKGREVSIGEVFVKAHTSKKDGTVVDGKAKIVLDAYEQKLQESQSGVVVDASLASDGASTAPQLTTEQKDALFMESNFLTGRGKPFGLGKLAESHGKGKTVVIQTSPTIQALKDELKTTKDEMAAQKQASDARMDMLLQYLKDKDPNLPAWLVQEPSEAPPGDPQTNLEAATATTLPNNG